MKKLISKIIVIGKHHVAYGKGNSFLDMPLKIEYEFLNLITAM